MEICQRRSAIGNKTDIANSLGDLGIIAQEQGDYPIARRLQEESLALRRAVGDRWGIALALGNLGNISFLEGDCAKARVSYEESLSLRRAVNDREGIAIALANLGDLAYTEGEYDRAFGLHEESLASQENKYACTFVLTNLGMDCLGLQRWEAAREYLAECLNLCQEIGSQRMIPGVLEGFALLAWHGQQSERAAVLYGSATAQRQILGLRRSPKEQQEYDQRLTDLHDRLSETFLEKAIVCRARLSLAQIAIFALDTHDTPRSIGKE
jgi:tetratricopeptide (TPR) repeat protein